MQLNRFTDLGLRVLISLQDLPDNQLSTVDILATQLAVSRNHLVKVVYFMAQTGWIKSYKGRNGGIRLTASSSQLRLGDIVAALEQTSSETTSLINCQHPPCTLNKHCPLPALFQQAEQTFYQTLNHYTLAQLHSHKNHPSIIQDRTAQPSH